jgi:hypothetical protein
MDSTKIICFINYVSNTHPPTATPMTQVVKVCMMILCALAGAMYLDTVVVVQVNRHLSTTRNQLFKQMTEQIEVADLGLCQED